MWASVYHCVISVLPTIRSRFLETWAIIVWKTQSEREYRGSVNRTLTHVALLVLLAPIAVCQTSYSAPDCSTLKYYRHKHSCLCGTVEICSGDICLSPSQWELDDDITVELRDKHGTTLDTHKTVIETSEEQGETQDGTKISIKLAERRFSLRANGTGIICLLSSCTKTAFPNRLSYSLRATLTRGTNRAAPCSCWCRAVRGSSVVRRP